MRLFAALFVAMAILFGGTQANAKNYATIINFQNPGKKYLSCEFSYRKITNNVIVYYENPVDRFFQPKDNIKISSNVGEIKIISETAFKLDDLTIEYKNNRFYLDGSVVVKNNNKNVITLTTKNGSNISVRSEAIVISKKGYNLTVQIDREKETISFFID